LKPGGNKVSVPLGVLEKINLFGLDFVVVRAGPHRVRHRACGVQKVFVKLIDCLVTHDNPDIDGCVKGRGTVIGEWLVGEAYGVKINEYLKAVFMLVEIKKISCDKMIRQLVLA